MILMDLIERLAKEDPTKVLRKGFTNPHSYRGYYDELAFEPAENVTVGSMMAAAESSLGREFTGYKGGEYTMGGYTDCWLAHYGDTGEQIGPTLLEYMLKDVVQ